MLKQAASGVLDSSKSSTYPRGYASGFDSPAALLAILFEHPVRCPTLAGWGKTIAAFWNFDGSRVWDKPGFSGSSGLSGLFCCLTQRNQTN